MQLIDSHCHLDFPAFDHDREDVLARARAAGVGDIVVPGVEQATWRRVTALATGEGLHHALGLHPLFLARHRPEHLEALPDAVAESLPVAVGEIGLDFYERGADRAAQRRYFSAQLETAAQCGLPVILHVRKAHDEVLELLRRYRAPGGIAHAFNGSRQQADRYIELGFKLGFGGMLTFERSRRLRELARDLPLDALVLETDAPDMTVAAHRGERNSPEYIPQILAAMAAVRPEPEAEIAAATSANARRVLALPQHAVTP